jgi:TatA/E family protein of Tat protein translocase
MLDIGVQEILVIMVLALIIFGPDKLPDLGRRLGRAMREFRRASDEFRSTVEQNLQLHLDPDTTSPAPDAPEAGAAPAVAAAGAADGQAGATDGHGAAVPSAEQGAGAGSVEAPTADELLEPYWTSRGGRLFHRRECAWRARVPASELVPLKTPADGGDQGLKPCPVCDPKEIAVAS